MLAGALVFLARWLRIAFLRIAYPYDLEWLEGVSVDHLERLMAGLPLYVEPGVDWVPFSYPPFYYLVAWPFAAVLGVGYLPLRLVSVLASLGSTALIAWIVARETGSRSAGCAAAGLFTATYRLGGAWFDVARVDTLFVFLVLLALALIVHGEGLRSAAAAGVALALAALTKQTAMGIAPALFIAALARPRRALTLTLACAAVWGAAVAWLHHASSGWFTYYAFQLPSRHYEYNCAPQFWYADVLRPLPVASALAAVYVLVALATRSWSRLARYAAPCAALTAAAWISRRHCGGYDNVLLPLHAALSLLAGLSLSLPRRSWLPGFLLITLIQLFLLNYDDAAQLPTPRDRAAFEDLVLRVRETPGDVWVFQHTRVPRAAGKPTFAHWMAVCDVLRDPEVAARIRLYEALNAAVDARRFAAVICDDDYFPVLIRRQYTAEAPVFSAPDVLFPRTGMPTRPRVWWRRH